MGLWMGLWMGDDPIWSRNGPRFSLTFPTHARPPLNKLNTQLSPAPAPHEKFDSVAGFARKTQAIDKTKIVKFKSIYAIWAKI